jgi:hypothetical protein
MAYYGEYLGDDVAAYKPLFEPRNHRLEPDSILYSPIRDLFREVNQAEDGLWRDQVSRYIDLAQVVTQAAIEMFLSERDGLLGYAGMNNFYVYRHANQSLHRLFPWDKDNTFEQADSPIFLRADENVLFRRAIAFPDLRALYLDVLEQCARSAAEDDWLSGAIERSSSLIADAAHEDVWKSVSNEEYDQATEFLKEFARRRSAFVDEEVAKARPARLRSSSFVEAAEALAQAADLPYSDHGQATSRPWRGSNGGTSSAQDGRAIGHRVRKPQPEGLLSGDGTSSPSRARRARPASGSGRGTADSSARVYGWIGW